MLHLHSLHAVVRSPSPSMYSAACTGYARSAIRIPETSTKQSAVV
jgi:hypothetical protein